MEPEDVVEMEIGPSECVAEIDTKNENTLANSHEFFDTEANTTSVRDKPKEKPEVSCGRALIEILNVGVVFKIRSSLPA